MGVKLGRLKYLQALLVGCEVKWAVAAAKEWQEECEQQEQRKNRSFPGSLFYEASGEGVEPAELRLAPAGSGGWVVVAWKRC